MDEYANGQQDFARERKEYRISREVHSEGKCVVTMEQTCSG